MLGGLMTFVIPTRLAQALIVAGALGTVAALLVFRPDNGLSFGVNILVGVALLIAAAAGTVALGRGGLPAWVGAPPEPERLRARVGPVSREWAVYLGAFACLPLFALLVSGFSVFTSDHAPVALLSHDAVAALKHSESGLMQVLAVFAEEVSKPAGLVLTVTGFASLVYVARRMRKLDGTERERLMVVLVLTFFSMLFWAFFEQAGSSINNFTDRNVDRVREGRHLSRADVGKTLELAPTQEQLGYSNGSSLFTLKELDGLRAAHEKDPSFHVAWVVAPDNVGMGVAERSDEVPASVFQAANAGFILVFGLVLTALWGALGKRHLEPSTPFKFALGLLQLSLGFVALWYGAHTATPRGMVATEWLLVGYLLHTTGELCLSPVGLSMVTRLTPSILVSTMMGMWFLASAFAQYLAAIISQFTGVGEESAEPRIPIPRETVLVYGGVFGKIALASLVAAAVCFALTPWLRRSMHQES